MSVRVRLTRVGSKKNPIWRVVVADQRSPRDGRFIEAIGHYNPQTQPSTIRIDEERFEHWVARGAQPSGTVKKLIQAQARSGPSELDGAGARAPVEVASPGSGAQEPETPEAEQVSGSEDPGATEGGPDAAAAPGEPAAGAEQPSAPVGDATEPATEGPDPATGEPGDAGAEAEAEDSGGGEAEPLERPPAGDEPSPQA